MSAKKKTAVKQGTSAKSPATTATSPVKAASRGPSPAADLLLVCLEDPFEAVGDSSNIVRVTVPTAAGTSAHLWVLETVMEMNPPRTFRGWATRSSFILDLKINATVFPANSGTWGGTVDTTSGIGNCRVTVSRGSNTKVVFSSATGSRHATERSMPAPQSQRFLNADIAFETDAPDKLIAGAVAVISNKNWDHLTAGSGAADTGMAFDNKWQRHLDPADGYAAVPGKWVFAVMTKKEYEKFCDGHGWLPYILE